MNQQMLLFFGRPGGLWALWIALATAFSLGSVSAQPGLSFQPLDLDVEDVRTPGGEGHILTVYYPRSVEEESLGSGDLWVVSPSGYNEEAELIEHRRGGGFFGFWTEATYWVPAPEEGWNQDHNGRYTVLLQPDAVFWNSGRALDPALLGAFEVAIFRERPLDVDIEIEREGSGYVAAVTLVFPHPGFDVVWGEVIENRRGFYVDPEITPPPPGMAFPAVIDEQTHRYKIPTPQPGRNHFEVRFGDEILASESFQVRPPEPVPAEVELEVAVADNGEAVVLARIHFLDPFYILADPGEPIWDARRHVFTIDATAESVVFIRPPDEPAITEVTYTLEIPEPGRHWVEFELNGFSMARERFEWYPAEPHPLPLGAQIVAHEIEGDWVLDVSIEVPEGAIVTQWRDYTRRGSHFTANVVLEWIPTDPLQLPPPALAPEHRYELGALAPDAYSFRLFSREEEIESYEFEVGRGDSIEAELRVGPVLQVGTSAHEMTVMYRSEGPFDLASFGDGDLVVKSWARFVDVFPLPIWASQSARLVSLNARAGDTRVEAVYEIDAPEGGWTAEHNGDFEVCLAQGEVRTLDGATVAERPIGNFDVDIEWRRAPARVDVSINEQNGALGADVRVEFFDFPYQTVVDWGEIVEVEPNHFVADATTEEVVFIRPPEEPIVESHRYRFPEMVGGEEVPFEILEFDEINVHKQEATFVARDLEGWLAVLGIPPELAPLVLVVVPVDLSERTILAVFGGEKPTGGFTIGIDRVLDRGDHLLVEYTETLPGPSGPDVLTYPQQLVTIPATDLPVRWSKSVIAFPSPPPIGEQEQGGDEAGGRGGQIELPIDILPISFLEFRMNGLPYAEILFSPYSGHGVEVPAPGATELAVRVDADGHMWMDVALDYGLLARGLRVVDWGRIEEGRGRRLYADVTIESQPPSVTLDAPEGVFEHTYSLGELLPGSHHFEMRVNGEDVDSLWFQRKGRGAFDAWLEAMMEEVGFKGRDQGNPGDIDGDGASDYEEWVLGSDGSNPEDDGELDARFGDRFEVSHHHRMEAGEGASYVEMSFDLVDWFPAETLCEEIRTREVGDGMMEVTYCLPTEANAGRPVFARVRVNDPGGD